MEHQITSQEQEMTNWNGFILVYESRPIPAVEGEIEMTSQKPLQNIQLCK